MRWYITLFLIVFLTVLPLLAAVMDAVGRDVALLSVMQLQGNKEALLEVVRGIVVPPTAPLQHAVPAPFDVGFENPAPLPGNTAEDSAEQVEPEPSAAAEVPGEAEEAFRRAAAAALPDSKPHDA